MLDPRDNPQLRRILTEEMPRTFTWLLQHGVRFVGPMPEPPHTRPRMHNVLPNSRSYTTHLERSARRAGVVIWTAARALSLLTEGGEVSGLEYERKGRRQRVSARCGVVLATGDFTSDPELKSRFMGQREAKIDGVNATATGDGQKLAIALGARIINGDLALGPELRFIPPQRPSLLRKLPPWSGLASAIGWSLERLPSAMLRPFVMKFVTTALAPSLMLLKRGPCSSIEKADVLPKRDRHQPSTWPISRKNSLTFCSTQKPHEPSKLGPILFQRRQVSLTPTLRTTSAIGRTYSQPHQASTICPANSAFRPLLWRRASPPTIPNRATSGNSEAALTLRWGRCAPCLFMPKEAWQ